MKTALIFLTFLIGLPVSSARQTDSQSVTEFCPHTTVDSHNVQKNKWSRLLDRVSGDKKGANKLREIQKGTGQR